MDIAGRQLDLREERLLRVRRKQYRAQAADTQLHATYEPSVVVEETNVWRSRGNNIAGHTRREKGLAIDQRKVIHLTRTHHLEFVRRCVRRRNRHQFTFWYVDVRAHATDR